jgi:hypothetical protein
MSGLKSYSKVYQLGHRETLGMFGQPVLVEEKMVQRQEPVPQH